MPLKRLPAIIATVIAVIGFTLVTCGIVLPVIGGRGLELHRQPNVDSDSDAVTKVTRTVGTDTNVPLRYRSDINLWEEKYRYDTQVADHNTDVWGQREGKVAETKNNCFKGSWGAAKAFAILALIFAFFAMILGGLGWALGNMQLALVAGALCALAGLFALILIIVEAVIFHKKQCKNDATPTWDRRSFKKKGMKYKAGFILPLIGALLLLLGGIAAAVLALGAAKKGKTAPKTTKTSSRTASNGSRSNSRRNSTSRGTTSASTSGAPTTSEY